MAYRSFSLIPVFSNYLLADRFTQIDNLFSRLTGENPLLIRQPIIFYKKIKNIMK
ncbi:MAG: hypothetical protein ACTS77_01615 [Arsenophonus sp. NC-TX2-MAG3]